MDGRRFDRVTRALASGASRRSILKGLLGLGGSAIAGTVLADDTDARFVSTRPTIPPPPPPSCPSGQAKCNGICCPYGRCFDGLCCPQAGTSRCGAGCCTTGQCTTDGDCCPVGQDACGTICCPDGLCAREGNTDVCCAAPNFVCGLECCTGELLCCDRECCPAGTVCLTRVFPEGPFVEEEVCCPQEQACDNQCCDGTCFDPEQQIVINGNPPLTAQLECCPAGGTVCDGISESLCCEGDTPQCCVFIGVPSCIAADACCVAEDCAVRNPGTDAACWTCQDGTCVPRENGAACGADGQRCCEQVCCDSGQICATPDNGGSTADALTCCTPLSCLGDNGTLRCGEPDGCGGTFQCECDEGDSAICCQFPGNPNAAICQNVDCCVDDNCDGDQRCCNQVCCAAGEICVTPENGNCCAPLSCLAADGSLRCGEPDGCGGTFACQCELDAGDPVLCCQFPGNPNAQICQDVGCCSDDDCGGEFCCETTCSPTPCGSTTTTPAPTTTTEPPCVQGPGFECCNTFDCVELGYGDVDCVGCQRDPLTGQTSCFVLDTGESCGPGLFCCDGDCTSGPQCGDLVCCFGQNCTEGECCDTFDCVELGYGNHPDCVSCTNEHTCVVEINNGTVCGVNPDAVCCSGFCTPGTTCDAPTTTTEPPLCISLGDACGNTLPSCCEGDCSPPAAGRCCIPDGQPCPPNPDDCCGACQSGTCGD